MEKKEITDKLLDETESKVQNTDNYGAEGELISIIQAILRSKPF